MAVFKHQNSKFLNLTVGSHKPAQGTPVHHGLSIQCSFTLLPSFVSNSSLLSPSPQVTWRKMISVLGAV